jgi:hypothetical protein
VVVEQIPALPTARITSGTFGLARIPAVDDARIPDLDTLSYGAAFATAQIPDFAAAKITSGTIGLARIPGTLTDKDADTVDGADAGVTADDVFKIPSGIAQGDVFHVNAGGSVVNLSAGTSGHFLKTFGAGTNAQWASVPGGGDMLKNVYDTDDNGIVDNTERLETNTLATVQAHNVAAAKITTGTFGLARIPAVDDVRIPDVDTLSYSGAFNGAQIPSLAASKITTGTFNANMIPILPTNRYGTALLRDGSRILTADWDIGDGRMIKADKIRARNGAGLALYEDGGAGIFIKDGGNVGICTTTPGGLLALTATTKWIKPGTNTLSAAAAAAADGDVLYLMAGTNTLSAAAAAAADGDVLYLMAGTYTQTAAITITSKSLSIFGAGPEVSIIKCTGCHGIVADTSSAVKCISLKDFTICTTDAGTYTAIDLEGVATSSSKQFNVENIFVKPFVQTTDYWAKGIRFNNGWDSKIIGCYIRGKFNDLNMSSGIELTGSSVNVQMDGNQLYFMDKGINIIGTSEGSYISDCLVVFANYGVRWLTPTTKYLAKIAGSHFDTFLRGVYLENADHSFVSDCLMYRRPGDHYIGIDCKTCTECTVTGNIITVTVDAFARNGIVFNGTDDSTVIGNVVRGCETDIWLQTGSDNNSVVGNIGNGSSQHIYDQGANNLVVSKVNNNMGICTSTPANSLAVNRPTNDGVVIDIEQADTVEGTISVSGTTVSYNAFMGAHFTQLKGGQKVPPVGALVIATGEIVPCEVHISAAKGQKAKDVSGVERKEYFSYVMLASERADTRVYGVYHAQMSDDAKGQSFGENDKPIHQIAALGLYKVRVTDTNGDIKGGNYIQSSIRPGEGERQDDDILHNYTVAKAIVDVDWDEVQQDQQMGYKWKLIPATLHCG